MYAVIKTGGKQYRVQKDDIIEVELLDAEIGASVTLDEVLLVGNEGKAKIGAPTVAGASVKANVLNQKRGDKIIVFKYKSKKDYRRKQGHRQRYTLLKVEDIVGA